MKLSASNDCFVDVIMEHSIIQCFSYYEKSFHWFINCLQ